MFITSNSRTKLEVSSSLPSLVLNYMPMEIKDHKTASQKLKWLKSAYQLWILDQQFLLELKLVLDDEFNEIILMLETKEIKTKPIGNNTLNAIYINNNGERRNVQLTFDEIEKLYQDITDSVDQNLQERIN